MVRKQLLNERQRYTSVFELTQKHQKVARMLRCTRRRTSGGGERDEGVSSRVGNRSGEAHCPTPSAWHMQGRCKAPNSISQGSSESKARKSEPSSAGTTSTPVFATY